MNSPSLKSLLLKNTGLRFAAQAVSMLVSLAAAFVLSRYLGVEKFGGINYVFAFYYFFLVLQDAGIDVIVVRECSQKPDQAPRIIGTMRIFKLALSMFLVAASWLIISIVSFPADIKFALYLYAFVLPLTALQVSSVIFQVKLDAKYPSLIAIIKSAVNFLFLILLVAFGLGLTGYVLALVLSEVAIMLAVLFFSRRFVRPENIFDMGVCVKVLKSSLPLALAGIFVAMTNRIDFLMLERMTGLRELGFYSAIYKVTNLLESLPLAMMATLYPVMACYAEHADRTALRKLHHKCLFLFLGIALPMGLAVTFFAEAIVKLLFGADFAPAAAGLQVLVWATVFLYPALSAGNVLISMGREKINLVINIFAALINVSLNLILIPKFGFVGAAQATAAAFLFISVFTVASAGIALKNK